MAVALFAVVLRFWPGKPQDPLVALKPADVVAVRDLSGDGPAPPRKMLAALAVAPRSDGSRINWAHARLIRFEFRSGLTLSLQVVRDRADALVRITADSSAAPDAKARAAAIRTLRGKAFRLSGASAVALLGNLRDSEASTELSTIIGTGAKQEQKFRPKRIGKDFPRVASKNHPGP